MQWVQILSVEIIFFIKISQLNLSSFVIIRSQENKLLTNKKVGFRELISDWTACLKTDWFYCSFTNIVAKEGTKLVKILWCPFFKNSIQNSNAALLIG